MMMDTSVDNNIGGNTGRSNNNSYSNNNFNFECVMVIKGGIVNIKGGQVTKDALAINQNMH